MKITGTGSKVPSYVVSNDEMATFLTTSDEWISTRTGIRERRVLTKETLRDLAADAARAAVQDAGITAADLDLILCSTVQGELITPALACMVQGEIGASCPAVDLNAACAGFLYALDMAEAYLKAGRARRILIVCAEGMSKLMDWTDRATCVLFGDGAGAAVVEPGDALKALKLTTQSDDSLIYIRPAPGNCPFVKHPAPALPLVMNGQEVYKFAVSACAGNLKVLLEETGLQPEAVDLFLLHQANLRIIDAVRMRLKQPKEKFPHNIERYGNMSSASVPVLLDEMSRAGKLKKGMTIALSAFGAGLNTGTAILRWEN